MSRRQRMMVGLLSGYGLTLVNLLFTLVSIPLALHYLSKEEFGIWAIALQFASYLLLIDLGVSASISRLLADHKDSFPRKDYADVFYIACFLSWFQAGALAALGGVLAWLAPYLTAVDSEQRRLLASLIFFQSLCTAVSLGSRSFSSPLWAYQRMDLSNLSNALGLILGFGGLWFGFHSGWGAYALVGGNALALIPGILVPWVFCRRNDYYPPWPGCRALAWSRLPELLRFSRDIFFLQLGGQLASATQVVLVSRMLSVEAAAVWAVMTKFFVFAQQICNRIMDSSAAALTEMFVRADAERFRRRFTQVVELSAWASYLGALGIVAGNSAVVSLWTGNKISWPGQNDFFLGFLLLVSCAVRCHLSISGITKRTSGFRWIQTAEAVVMMSIALLGMRAYGFSAVLVATIFAHTLVTGWFVLAANRRLLQLSVAALVPGWPALASLYLVTSWLLSRLPAGLSPWQSLAGGLLVLLPSVGLSWFWGLSRETRNELRRIASALSRR